MQQLYPHVLLNNICTRFQLDLITDLLGTPPLSALASACEGARAHILRGPHKPVRDCVESTTTFHTHTHRYQFSGLTHSHRNSPQMSLCRKQHVEVLTCCIFLS